MPSYGGLEMKSLFMLGAGALGAKVAVNSIANAANLTNPTVATVVKIGGKVALGLAAITQSDNEDVQAAGVGAVTIGLLEAVEYFLHEAMKTKLGIVSMGGIGETIDLNSDEWAEVSGDGDDAFDDNYNVSGDDETGLSGI